MNKTGVVLGKGPIGACRYWVRQTGADISIEMRGYGLKSLDTYKLKRGHTFDQYDATQVADILRQAETRMRGVAHNVLEWTRSKPVEAGRSKGKAIVGKKSKGSSLFQKLLDQV